MAKSKHEIQREERRQQIVSMALELFSRYGFHAVSVSRIAKNCGMSKGLLYNYFESKEALLKFILQDYAQEIYKALDISRDRQLSTEDFRYFVRTVYAMVKANPKYYKLIFSLSFQEEVAADLAAMAAQNLPFTGGMLKSYFERLGYADPESELLYFSSVLKGLLLQVVMVLELPGMSDYIKSYDALVERIINDYSK